MSTQPAAARTSWIPLACLLAVGALLGLAANLAKVAIGAGLLPLSYLFWSAAAAGLILAGIAAATGGRISTKRRFCEYALVSGLLSIAVPNGLAFSAIPHVGSGFVSITLAFPPLLTYLLALVFGIERWRAIRAAGVAIGLCGTLILAVGKLDHSAASPVWIVAALASPLVIAAGNIYRTRRWPPGASPWVLAPAMLIGAAVELGLFQAAAGTLTPPFANATQAALVAAQALVFVATYLLYFELQKRAGPVYLSQIGSVGAAVGTALAVVMFAEHLTPAFFVAAGTIALGAVLVSRRV